METRAKDTFSKGEAGWKTKQNLGAHLLPFLCMYSPHVTSPTAGLPFLRGSPDTPHSPQSELRGQRSVKATLAAGVAARWLCRSRQTTAGR